MFTLVYFIYNIVKIHLIQKKAFLITSENEPELYQQYISCHEKLKIRRHVALYASCNISSPVSYGLLYPKVIIPQDMDILLSEQYVYYIFLHELHHYKHKDAALNYISCILPVSYTHLDAYLYSTRDDTAAEITRLLSKCSKRECQII